VWASLFSRSFVAGACATVIVACSSSVGKQNIPAGGAAAVPSAATKHLYVIEFDSVKAVLEYPIRAGIPDAKTDRVVTGLVGPNAIALDDAGRLYVLDGRIVKEFAAGAAGHARPIREIDVPISLNIGTLAIDALGYVYVGQKGRVFVYAPQAHGHAKPIAIITPVGYPAGAAIDAGGAFYVLGNTQKMHPTLTFKAHVSVYTTPSQPTRIREFCTHYLPNHGIDYGVALDGSGNLFTTHPFFINSYPYGEIDVFAADANACPIDPTGTITTSNPSLRGPVYLAVDSPYLYVYDLDYGSGGVVFALRTTGSPQTPLSILYVANKQPHNVQGIAIGP
jgi:hypothetical protein